MNVKLSDTLTQWIQFICMVCPTWIWTLLPTCVSDPISVFWGGLNSTVKGSIVTAVGLALVSAVTVFIRKKRADRIRPWSTDGKNDTPDINIKSPENGDPYIQVLGRSIKASFLTAPMSYIFDPIFRVVTKYYFMGDGYITTPTPKPISKIRDDDYSCDFTYVDMVIRGAAADEFYRVLETQNDLPEEQRNKDLVAALQCIKDSVPSLR